MSLVIDHAPFAWSDLDDLVERFVALGFEPEYGGRHGNGSTHMSVVAFADGSYLELVSTVGPETEPDLWPGHVKADGGPAAWCVSVGDVAPSLHRAIDLGVPVSGPRTMSRERPDGTVAEWDVGFVGEPGDGANPFVIADRTPRRYRVSAPEVDAGGPLAGVAEVVVAVDDLDATAEEFRQLYRLPTPRRTAHPTFGARLALFPGQPVTLATPSDDASWLADRLDRYGNGPCAFLLGSYDLDRAAAEYPLADPISWGGRRVAWFDADWADRRLGVVEREHG